MFKKLFFLLVFSFSSFVVFSQAAEYLDKAQSAFNRNDISQARYWINQINPPFSTSKKVSDLRNRISAAEKNQRDREAAREAEAGARIEYDAYCIEAEDYFESGDYKNALSKVKEALSLGVSNKSTAKTLKEKIETRWSDQIISYAETAIQDNDFYQARDLYREAQNIKYSNSVTNELTKLSDKIYQHEFLVKQAENEYKKGNNQACIDKLIAANEIILLNKIGSDLKKNASMKLNIQNGEKFFKEANWKEASTSFGKAKEYATNKTDLDNIIIKLNLATYNMKIEEANTAFNNNEFSKAIELISDAEKSQSLSQKDLDLLSKSKSALEEKLWKEIENTNNDDLYQDYLNRFPNGRHATETKEKLVTSLIISADALLKNHSYTLAREKYKSAQEFNSSNIQLSKKIKKVDRWAKGLGSGLSVDFFLPLGYNKTVLETDDIHSYTYGSINGPIDDTDYGKQKIYSQSVITPLQFSINNAYTIRIKGILPINVNASFKAVLNKGVNLSRVEPLDYSIYGVGESFKNTTNVVTSVDTFSNYFTNAYKFSQYQFKIGIQPFSYIEIYMPINRMTFQFQNDYNCLDCAKDDITIGQETKIGLGLKANYSFDFIGKRWLISGYYENWNKSFNSRTTNNSLSDPTKKAGSGFISLSPFSRSLGLNLGFHITGNFDLFFNYTNNRIRGKFATTTDPLVALRGFYQNIVSISFKYHIHFKHHI